MTLSCFRDYSKLLTLWCALCCALSCAPRTPAQPVRVAAAADLQFALETLAADYAKTHGASIERVYGSSGNFYSQIRNGAPFDLFLSADMDYPRKLAQEGFADPSSLFLYAQGRIVLWAPEQSAVDVTRLQIHALEEGAVKRIAIANPAHAPYGRAAEAAMRKLGVYDAVAPKLVFGENIAQTMQFVQSGAADAGIVALSLALAPTVRGHGHYWEIPMDAYPKLEQGGVVLTHAHTAAHDASGARAFATYLRSAQARGIWKDYGFRLPEN